MDNGVRFNRQDALPVAQSTVSKHWRQLKHWRQPENIITAPHAWSLANWLHREGMLLPLHWLSNTNTQTRKLHCLKMARITKLATVKSCMAQGCSSFCKTQYDTVTSCNYLKHWWVCWMLMEASTIAVAYIIHAEIRCQVKIPSPASLIIL